MTPFDNFRNYQISGSFSVRWPLLIKNLLKEQNIVFCNTLFWKTNILVTLFFRKVFIEK